MRYQVVVMVSTVFNVEQEYEATGNVNHEVLQELRCDLGDGNAALTVINRHQTVISYNNN